MKSILIKIVSIVLILIVAKLAMDYFGLTDLLLGDNSLKIETSAIDIGNLVLGKKISIRDQIKIEKSASYHIDGPFGSLGNETKDVKLSFLAEMGYFPKDIIRSEKIDTIKNEEVKGRTLLVELPLPDTLQFYFMKKDEKEKGWFWEGWNTDTEYNKKIRTRIIDSLRNEAYSDFKNRYIYQNITTCLEESTRTMFNYINTAYKIANEKGFSTIIAIYNYEMEGRAYQSQIICQENGQCEIARIEGDEGMKN